MVLGRDDGSLAGAVEVAVERSREMRVTWGKLEPQDEALPSAEGGLPGAQLAKQGGRWCPS